MTLTLDVPYSQGIKGTKREALVSVLLCAQGLRHWWLWVRGGGGAGQGMGVGGGAGKEC